MSESLKSAQNFAWYVADALPVSCCHGSYYYYYVIIIITTTALVSFILSLSSLSQHIPAFLNKCLTNLSLRVIESLEGLSLESLSLFLSPLMMSLFYFIFYFWGHIMWHAGIKPTAPAVEAQA